MVIMSQMKIEIGQHRTIKGFLQPTVSQNLGGERILILHLRSECEILPVCDTHSLACSGILTKVTTNRTTIWQDKCGIYVAALITGGLDSVRWRKAPLRHYSSRPFPTYAIAILGCLGNKLPILFDAPIAPKLRMFIAAHLQQLVRSLT